MTDASLIRGDRVSLEDIARQLAEQKRPPVDRWDPPFLGHSAMRIARDGTWFHEGAPIGRPEMVRLFASILRREPGDNFVLVTPVEKLAIDVDDAPFVAVAMTSEGEGRDRTLAFELNTGDFVVADADHRLRVAEGEVPYLHVRGGLEALVARPLYYELAELAIAESASPPGVWSRGAFFPLGASA